MTENDYDEFSRMIRKTCRMLSRGGYIPDGDDLQEWFRVLSRFSIEAVRYGLDAHMADPKAGRYSPTPADVIAKIEARIAQDGRPGAEEAWALTVKAADEQQTVVWTQEMSEAFAIARPILLGGDEVGARMAFREAYTRLVEAARAARVRPSWSVSEGHDPQLRAVAVQAASVLGRLAAPEVSERLALPASRGAMVDADAALTGSAAPDSVRESFLGLKYRLSGNAAKPSADAEARQATSEAKARAAAQVRARLSDEQ